MSPQADGQSHVFVTMGNLAHLATDAWLLPTARTANVTGAWRPHLSAAELARVKAIRGHPEMIFQAPGARVEKLIEAPESRAWLTNVGSHSGRDVSWYLEGVGQFFDAVEEHLGTNKAILNGRARPLVGINAVGTGHGGAAKRKGEIAAELLPFLHKQAEKRPFDIVLVTFDQAMFGAAQQARRPYLKAQPGQTALTSLAAHARSGSLVLFVGAGVSMGAGLPGWGDLLQQVAGAEDTKSSGFKSLDVLDQAQIIERRLNEKSENLGAKVVEILQGKSRYSLGHSLLANLPIKEVATTNYDQLFEDASKDAREKVSVLRYKPDATRRRWLLKMHGCVSKPEEIVLTRSDYLQYQSRRAALAGIVQALLVTKHMLFVGFSLSDANFHRIAHEVRLAIRPDGQSGKDDQFATSLTLIEDEFLQEVWQSDITFVAMEKEPAVDVSRSQEDQKIVRDRLRTNAARRLDIFLDQLVAECTNSTHHILANEYNGLLSQAEIELKRAVRQLESAGAANPKMRSTRAWQKVQVMLNELGAEDKDPTGSPASTDRS